jgi:lysophospholipase L1-like esterase
MLFTPLSETDKLNDPTRWMKDVQRLAGQTQLSGICRPILFVGSSTFVMWPDLKKSLGLEDLCNHAFGGSTIYDIVYYASDLILPFAPRALVVSSGDNDLARGKHPKLVFEDFRMLCRLVWYHFADLPVYFVSIKPSPGRHIFFGRQYEVNQKVNDWSSEEERVHYISIVEPMLDEDGRPRSDIFLEDGIHLNPSGYDLWGEVLSEALHSQKVFPVPSLG